MIINRIRRVRDGLFDAVALLDVRQPSSLPMTLRRSMVFKLPRPIRVLPTSQTTVAVQTLLRKRQIIRRQSGRRYVESLALAQCFELMTATSAQPT